MEHPEDTAHEVISGHDLTVEEASALFTHAGVPRSPRTIRRYCRNGHLECVLADTELADRYMVNRPSVERRIDELLSLVTSGHDRSRPDTSGHDLTRPVTSDQVASEETSKLEERVTELENDNLNLRIDNKAKEQIIGHMSNERKEILSELTQSSRQIGVLETRLQALEAPKVVPDVEEGSPQEEGSNPQHSEEGGAVEYEHGGT